MEYYRHYSCLLAIVLMATAIINGQRHPPLLLSGASSTVRVDDLTAPQPARYGDTVQLTCSWRVVPDTNGTNGTGFSQEKLWKDGHQLYNIDSDGENSDYKLQDIHVVSRTGFSQVKWWKDGNQLYKIDSDGVKTDYKLQDIHVVLDESNIHVVVLRDVGRSSEGSYTCEVMGKEPTFKTTNATVNLIVAEIPESLDIVVNRPPYRTGEILNVTCIAFHARPAAVISFLVNGRVVQPHHMLSLLPAREPGGAFTSKAQLTLPVREEHEPMMQLTCRAKVLGISTEESVQLRVERAAHSLFSIFGAGNRESSSTMAFVLITSLPFLHALLLS